LCSLVSGEPVIFRTHDADHLSGLRIDETTSARRTKLAIEYVPAFAAAADPSKQRFEVLFVRCAAIR
jgi:hypothetical protein